MKNLFNVTSLGLVLLIFLLFYIYYNYFRINEGYTSTITSKQLKGITMDSLRNSGLPMTWLTRISKSVKSITFTHDPALNQNPQKCTENNSIHCNIIFQNLEFILNGANINMNNYVNTILPNLVKIDIVLYPPDNSRENVNNKDFPNIADFQNIFTQINKDGSRYTGVPINNYMYFIIDYLQNGVTSISVTGNGETPTIGTTLPNPPKVTLSGIDVTVNGDKTLAKYSDFIKDNPLLKTEFTIPNEYALVDFFNLVLYNVYGINVVTNNDYEPLYYLIANAPIPTTAAPVPTIPNYASNPFSEHTYSNSTYLNYS